MAEVTDTTKTSGDVTEQVKTELGSGTTDNTVVDETLESKTGQQQTEISILDIPIENENVALNVLVSFLNLGQRRGIFSVPESAKIWECIQKFQKTQQ